MENRKIYAVVIQEVTKGGDAVGELLPVENKRWSKIDW